MVAKTSPFRIPFPRRFLIRIHQDLFRIEKYAKSYVFYPRDLILVEKMVLISEDRRFFRHNGVDYISCLRELFKAITLRRFGGASTIDMQFVRMATGYYEMSMRRKLYEMLLAWLIQFRYSKIEILRFYLRHAFFGSRIYGMSAASRIMFSKYPDYLSEREAAEVAAMLVYPRPRRPTEEWSRKIARRSNYIISLFPRLEKRFEKLPSWDAI